MTQRKNINKATGTNNGQQLWSFPHSKMYQQSPRSYLQLYILNMYEKDYYLTENWGRLTFPFGPSNYTF